MEYEAYEYYAVNVPRINEHGNCFCGIPTRFRLIKSTMSQSFGKYNVVAIVEVWERSWAKYREKTRCTNIYLTEEEVEYALVNKQFARKDTDDQLLKTEHTAKQKRKKSPRK